MQDCDPSGLSRSTADGVSSQLNFLSLYIYNSADAAIQPAALTKHIFTQPPVLALVDDPTSNSPPIMVAIAAATDAMNDPAVQVTLLPPPRNARCVRLEMLHVGCVRMGCGSVRFMYPRVVFSAFPDEIGAVVPPE